MKKKLTVALFMCFLGIFLGGCGTKNTVYLERTMGEVETVGEIFSEAGVLRSDELFLTEGTAVEDIEEVEQESSELAEEVGSCFVYVCGAVEKPGVYELPSDGRIYEAIALAGGLKEDACKESLNQAERIMDGQMIRVLTEEEAASLSLDVTSTGGADTSTGTSGAGTKSASGVVSAGDKSESGTASVGAELTTEDLSEDGRIDLNAASVTELMTLPGIGEAKADSIIAYRDAKGGFSSISEIMNIDGIKEGVYNRIKDYIKVK